VVIYQIFNLILAKNAIHDIRSLNTQKFAYLKFTIST